MTMNTILRKQFLAHVGQTSPSPMLVEVERAEGSFFYTPEGKRYYDLVAGVSVSNVGHCNPAVVRAVQEQAARYMHVMVYGELVETPQVEYASKLCHNVKACIALFLVYIDYSINHLPKNLSLNIILNCRKDAVCCHLKRSFNRKSSGLYMSTAAKY